MTIVVVGLVFFWTVMLGWYVRNKRRQRDDQREFEAWQRRVAASELRKVRGS